MEKIFSACESKPNKLLMKRKRNWKDIWQKLHPNWRGKCFISGNYLMSFSCNSFGRKQHGSAFRTPAVRLEAVSFQFQLMHHIAKDSHYVNAMFRTRNGRTIHLLVDRFDLIRSPHALANWLLKFSVRTMAEMPRKQTIDSRSVTIHKIYRVDSTLEEFTTSKLNVRETSNRNA